MCSPTVLSKSYGFNHRPRLPFLITAKRYWIEKRRAETGYPTFREDALTFVFIHGNGGNKEHWEPTIQRLFDHQENATRKTVRIHEIWTLDLPNHGDSSMLNQDALRLGNDTLSCENYSHSVHSSAFLAGIGTGGGVDHSKRRIVLVGHSMGGTASILATVYHPLLQIVSLHLVEPLLGQEKNIQSSLSHFAETTGQRRDSWPDSEEIFQALKIQPMLHARHGRVLHKFVKHGLQPLPTAEYSEGVALKRTREQDAATTPEAAYQHSPQIVTQAPTHITFGVLADYMSNELRHDVLRNGSGDMSNFAGMTWIPEGGHMILQTHPDALADNIWKSVTKSHEHTRKESVIAKL